MTALLIAILAAGLWVRAGRVRRGLPHRHRHAPQGLGARALRLRPVRSPLDRRGVRAAMVGARVPGVLDTCGRLSGGWAGGGDVTDTDRARLDSLDGRAVDQAALETNNVDHAL